MTIGEEEDVSIAVRAYLTGIMASLSVASRTSAQGDVSGEETPAKVFQILTSRDFCYLSKIRVAPYRETIIALIRQSVREGAPIHFRYDLGGGYHATVLPGKLDLCFDVGLAELLVLHQVTSFAARVRDVYALGIKCSLVIDNIAAFLINDIDLEKTARYCDRLRELIRQTGSSGMVDLIVESEHFSVADLEGLCGSAGTTGNGRAALTRQHHANIERFLGRPCDEVEARQRAARYQPVIDASDHLLNGLIRAVHMTQRATDTTICFRPFPGGDSRIQCGEVALATNAKGRLRPILVTSQNVKEFAPRRYRFPELLPRPLSYVTYAERISSDHTGHRERVDLDSPWAASRRGGPADRCRVPLGQARMAVHRQNANPEHEAMV